MERQTRREFLGAIGSAAFASTGRATVGSERGTVPLGPPVGYAVYGNGKMDIADQILALRDRGFTAVQFEASPALAPHQTLDVSKFGVTGFKRLRSALSGFQKVEVHGPFSDWDISLVSPNSDIRRASLQVLERSILFAASIGADVFTTHPGVTHAPVATEEQIKLLTDSLYQLARIGERRKFLVCVETAELTANTANVRAFAPIQSDFLGITLDTGHISFWGALPHPLRGRHGYDAYGSVAGFIKAWGKRIRHVHLNDYNSTEDHIGVGTGQLPLEQVLTALHQANYQGFFVMEIKTNVVPPDSRELIVERNHVQELVNRIWARSS
jgi:sugar phosphate isomerase/epimerase